METLLRRHALATQHNFLIHAPLNLNNVEVMIFSLALACIHKNDEELPPISMRFTDVFESTAGSNYAALAKAMDSLVGKRVKLQSITTKRTQIKVYNIISSLEFDTNTGLITGRFSQEIEPYLIALRRDFTSMEVEMLLTLKNAHTHRLAWFLKAHEYQKGVEISLVNLRKILFGEEPGYADYFEFKRKVLNPALVELNKPTGINWNITMTEMKKGLRQVIGLSFKIPELQAKFIKELSDKKLRKSSVKNKVASVPRAPVVRMNKDEPTPLSQIVQATSAQPTLVKPGTVPPPSAYVERITSRLNKLQVTPAQIAKVIKHVGSNEELFIKLMNGTRAIQLDYEAKNRKFDNVGAEAMSAVKTVFPTLYYDEKRDKSSPTT